MRSLKIGPPMVGAQTVPLSNGITVQLQNFAPMVEQVWMLSSSHCRVCTQSGFLSGSEAIADVPFMMP